MFLSTVKCLCFAGVGGEGWGGGGWCPFKDYSFAHKKGPLHMAPPLVAKQYALRGRKETKKCTALEDVINKENTHTHIKYRVRGAFARCINNIHLYTVWKIHVEKKEDPKAHLVVAGACPSLFSKHARKRFWQDLKCFISRCLSAVPPADLMCSLNIGNPPKMSRGSVVIHPHMLIAPSEYSLIHFSE